MAHPHTLAERRAADDRRNRARIACEAWQDGGAIERRERARRLADNRRCAAWIDRFDAARNR